MPACFAWPSQGFYATPAMGPERRHAKRRRRIPVDAPHEMKRLFRFPRSAFTSGILFCAWQYKNVCCFPVGHSSMARWMRLRIRRGWASRHGRAVTKHAPILPRGDGWGDVFFITHSGEPASRARAGHRSKARTLKLSIHRRPPRPVAVAAAPHAERRR